VKHHEFCTRPKFSQGCIEALFFEGMEQREQNIQEACEGTCLWFLTDEKYLTWKSEASALLWLKGKPGAGKSTLLKYALNKERHIPNSKVVSFFFHGRGSDLQKTPLGLWRSLLYQILKQIPDLRDQFRAKFDKRFRAQGEHGMASDFNQDELQDFFRIHVTKKHPVTIFIDALDECGVNVATKLIEYFQDLARRSGSTTRVCFSCRHYPAFGDGHKLATIFVEDQNRQDIIKYIRDHLASPFKGQQDKQDILLDMISNKASGSFQWANIACSLASQKYLDGISMTKILDMLRKAPEILSKLYDTLVDKIPSEDRPSALRLIQWIYLAARPLSVTELRFAMALGSLLHSSPAPTLHTDLEASDEYEDDDQMEKRVRHLSGGLAEIKSQEEEVIVQLIHESVNEFLAEGGLEKLAGEESSSIEEGHYQLSRVCINYATLEDICKRAKSGKMHELPFLRYAVIYWGYHMEKAGSATTPQNGLPNDHTVRFEWPSDDITQRWIEAYRIVNNDEQATLLHYSCEHGLLNSVKLFLEQDVDIECEDNEGQTPLSLAATHGHFKVTALLLENGANADFQNDGGKTSLMYAAEHGQDEIVELLLSNNVDMNSCCRQMKTPLCYASRNGHAGTVKILLKRGAKADLKDSSGRTPLSYAAEKGYAPVVELLLLTGCVDADSQNPDNQTPLWYAAGNGHDNVVELLLQKDVSIDEGDRYGQTPLSWAADNGRLKVVEQLLARKDSVKIDSKDSYGRTPLWYASDNGHAEVVKLLLQEHADPNLADKDRWTPLHFAAGNGHEAVVLLLLQNGANIDAEDGDGDTPLSWAEEGEGKLEVAKLLRETKANQNK
jgi:ankyrin repeat protein